MSQQPLPEILFVSHKYPPATGGMEKQSYELIQGSARYAKIHKLVFRKDKESLLTFFFLLNHRILTLLKAHPQIQVIHFNDGLIASLALSHKGYGHLRKMVTLHGLDIVFPWAFFQKRIIPKLAAHYDKIITVSQATADAAIWRGVPREKVYVIPNGVDTEGIDRGNLERADLQRRFPHIATGQKYLITLGRPVQRKGFSWLLEEVVLQLPADVKIFMVGPFQKKTGLSERLLYALPKKFRSLLFLFLGYPSDQAAIRRLLKKREIKDRVIHFGKVPFSDLKLLLANASAFLMPNIRVDGDMEGFGLVCLEASLAGTLVIASKIDGITDAIKQDRNGILLPSNDAKAWVAQLEELFSDEEHFRMAALRYQEYSRNHYGWDKMCRKYVELMLERRLVSEPVLEVQK